MEDTMKVQRWLRTGNISNEANDTDAILDESGGLLDDACAYEILDSPVFQGDDGKYYVVTLEASIAEANSAFVKGLLDDMEESK
jgi:hypothetical protein